MREILFRGKELRGYKPQKWVEGGYFKEENCGHTNSDTAHFIVNDNMENIEIEPATLGQYTGLTDKNGKRIFEGDIIRFSNNPIHEGATAECWFAPGKMMWVYRFITHQNENYIGKCTDMTDGWREYEVIGNIHDGGGESCQSE